MFWKDRKTKSKERQSSNVLGGTEKNSSLVVRTGKSIKGKDRKVREWRGQIFQRGTGHDGQI